MEFERPNVTDTLIRILNSPLCVGVGERLGEVFKIPQEDQVTRQLVLDRIVKEVSNKLNQDVNVS